MTDQPSAAKPLKGVRVIEFASFVAGPSGGMALAQMGADVIRIDPLGGAADYTRWPLSQRSGDSLFWTSLNRGKRSVALDVRSTEGREILLNLVAAPGKHAGILVDNNPGAKWLSYEALAARRADVIKVHIQGNADGSGAVDYTVNPAVGVPGITGPAEHGGPVNHALPAWDLLAGSTATTGLLAALRHRDLKGEGTHLQIALADVALAGLANMGWLAEADELGHDRERVGNYLYGSYGADFSTADGERVMIIALTARQWSALCQLTGTDQVFSALAESLGVDWSDEGSRFTHREIITAVLRPWFSSRTFAEAETALTEGRALWSKYKTFTENIAEFRESTSAPAVLADVAQPGIGTVVSARSPLRAGAAYGGTHIAPELGAHTEEVLSEVLGMSSNDFAKLASSGVVGGAA